jgi:hypothetical protein
VSGAGVCGQSSHHGAPKSASRLEEYFKMEFSFAKKRNLVKETRKTRLVPNNFAT